MKTFEVTVRIRNNRLKQRREELGLASGEFARRAGVSPSTYSALETMRESPWGADGDWRPVAILLSEFHGCALDDLFPGAIKRVKNTTATRRLDERDMARLMESAPRQLMPPADEMLEAVEASDVIDKALARLSSREERVIRTRFGLNGSGESATYEEIGQDSGVTRERIRQIEATALRRLRHPSIAKIMRDL